MDTIHSDDVEKSLQRAKAGGAVQIHQGEGSGEFQGTDSSRAYDNAVGQNARNEETTGNAINIDGEVAEVYENIEMQRTVYGVWVSVGVHLEHLRLHADLIFVLKGDVDPCTENCFREDFLSLSTVSQRAHGLKDKALLVNCVNPVLGTFCREVIRLKKPLKSKYRRLVECIISILQNYLGAAKMYFETSEKGCPEQSKSYRRTWADIESTGASENRLNIARENEMVEQVGMNTGGAENELTQADLSGVCFPERQRVRPCILLKSKNEEGCNKNYKASKSQCPGLLTVQCACNSPKLLGFVIMQQAELVSMALSALLSHFRVFPRTVYYDHACNLFLSAMLRTTWVLGETRFLVDIFHSKSHNSSSYFDPNA